MYLLLFYKETLIFLSAFTFNLHTKLLLNQI